MNGMLLVDYLGPLSIWRDDRDGTSISGDELHRAQLKRNGALQFLGTR